MAKEVNSNFFSCRQTPNPYLPTSKTGPVFSSECCLCEDSRSSMLRPHCYCERPETSSSRSVALVEVTSLCHGQFSVPGTFDSWVRRTFASSSSHCPFCALVWSTRNLTSFKPYLCFVRLGFQSKYQTKSQRLLATWELCSVLRARDFKTP